MGLAASRQPGRGIRDGPIETPAGHFVRRRAGRHQHGGWHVAREARLADLKTRDAEALSLSSRSVITEIERFRYLPFVLARDERVQQLLDGGGGGEITRVATTTSRPSTAPPVPTS